MNELVLSEDRGRVRVLTLNRPEVLNALNPAIVEALAERIEDVRNDSNVLALILTGSGRAFAAGADIGEMRKMTPLQGVEFSRRGHEVLGAMEEDGKVILVHPSKKVANGLEII